MAEQQAWQLPLAVVGPIDIGRLIREAEVLDDFLLQATIRQPGTTVKLPKTTRLMDELIQLNGLNVLQDTDRLKLKNFLKLTKAHAPVINISFSADPSPLFLQKIMVWLRTEINPSVLIRVGLQPNIGAGCVLRTPNHYFDMSLRQHFYDKRHVLIQKLEAINRAEPVT
ncbi:MAG: hypothetical protein NVS1B7_7310 [Candidatus Saccharimonadales bacterium]